jgi:hypothetical protein
MEIFNTIIGIICDYGENIFINSFIKDIVNIREARVLIANIFTKIKFISVYGSLLLIIILLAIFIIKKIKVYKENGALRITKLSN